MAKEHYTYRICSAVTPFEGELINVCNVSLYIAGYSGSKEKSYKNKWLDLCDSNSDYVQLF